MVLIPRIELGPHPYQGCALPTEPYQHTQPVKTTLKRNLKLGAWQCPTLAWRMPHYHRRYSVSLLSSAWGQVVPPRPLPPGKNSI